MCSAVISFRNTHENAVCNFLLEPPMGSKISQAGSMHISAAILILTERGITNSYVINISQTSPLRGRPHKISTKVFLNYESVCIYLGSEFGFQVEYERNHSKASSRNEAVRLARNRCMNMEMLRCAYIYICIGWMLIWITCKNSQLGLTWLGSRCATFYIRQIRYAI